jgi:sialate O-acetylesterase
MSGTAYFFGRNLHEKLGRPVGLVVSAVGGTPIESWTSRDVLASVPELKDGFETMATQAKTYYPKKAQEVYEKRIAEWDALIAKLTAEGKPLPKPKQKPRIQPDPRSTRLGNLFNGKIAPLMPYRIAGAIWYQGEANTHTVQEAARYARSLPAMIADWRSRWGQGDFPFAWVQLPRYRDDRFPGWCDLRESQLKTLAVPNTGMAVMIDTGDPKGIHPNNKAETGRRLALWALANVYGQDIPFSGPLPAGHDVRGNEIVCSFSHADGLKPKGGVLKGFEIAGDDKRWVPAAARIDGTSVVVSSVDVPVPVAVRYGWKDDADCTLVNGADLPASPFRTHDWP